ncbi:tRNA pseudouridine synthase B [Nymphaea thermarum]|nr:tRNA pseudouridine synthase B [Nymphaea thermarum]
MAARAGLLTLRLRPAATRAAVARPTVMTTFSSRLLLPHSSFSSTPFPLQYELITSHPVLPLASPRRSRTNPDKDLAAMGSFGPQEGEEEMDKSKRKYYLKRRKRMYGSDSDDERRRGSEEFVEMRPEVVEFPTLHAREEELYFYDAFAFPWEKDKHYRMVHQLEKKYFPGQGLENAFLQPGEERKEKQGKGTRRRKVHEGGEEEGDDKRLMFFEDGNEKKPQKKTEEGLGKKVEVSERNVEEFFKGLSKGPRVGDVTGEPYVLTRTDVLPARWDGPSGTVVLIDKPKGWTSFTVCGKLRRLVKVQKVGHAGTLDPMATGLLIVCVGKATKQVERFQDMFKGYSGVFRLGEATSTWDADSPVIQREPWEHIKDEDIKRVAASFCGEIWQVPPMFSAIKVGGEKLYEKARRGETIDLSARRVSIFQFDIERSLDDRQNLIFRVTCSKGTYIRSLCADFGKALGSCAHLTALRRDLIGKYSADDAWDFQELQEQITKGYM